MGIKPHLTPRFLQHLADHNPLGQTITTDEVQAWWDYTFLRYDTYNYKNHRRAIARWWSRVKPEDLEASWDRRMNLLSDPETVAAQRMQHDLNAFDPPTVVPTSGIFRARG